MKIGLAADHAGFELKQMVALKLRELDHEITDFGAHAFDPDDDYPDFSIALARAVRSGVVERGILACGSGVGASVAANKVPGIRAGLCADHYSAHQGVEHDDMNIIVIAGRVVGPMVAWELVEAFLSARFTGEERHRRRLGKIAQLEKEVMGGGQ